MTRKRKTLVALLALVVVVSVVLRLGDNQLIKKTFVKFYDESGNSNEEIYEIPLSKDLESALQKKVTLKVEPTACILVFSGGESLQFKEASDPFSSMVYIEDVSWDGCREIAGRQVLSDLSEIVGRFVLMTFHDKKENDYYSVIKIG